MKVLWGEAQQLVVAVAVIKKYLLTFFLIGLMIQNSFAEMMEKGKTKFKLLFNFYHQNSDEGKQVADNSGREEANVVEPMLFIEHQIKEDTALSAHVVFDLWTAASDTKLDAQTGASGEEPIKGQTRVSGNLNIKHEHEKWTLGGGIGFSSEYDYRSLNANLSIQRAFAKDNFNLAFGLQYYSDEIRLFDDITPANSALISEFVPRKIFATSITASQLLTRKDIIQFGLNFVQAKDNLESTANTVLINNVREVESLPETRSRYAISTKWVHGLGNTAALNVFYRYYFDQWELEAHTIRTALLKEINDDEDFLEVALRLHKQTNVEYFGESFSTANQYMTSDSDMDAFTSYELSLFLTSTYEDTSYFGFSFEDIKWNNGITFYKRSNGLYYAYLQTALGFQF